MISATVKNWQVSATHWAVISLMSFAFCSGVYGKQFTACGKDVLPKLKFTCQLTNMYVVFCIMTYYQADLVNCDGATASDKIGAHHGAAFKRIQTTSSTTTWRLYINS